MATENGMATAEVMNGHHHDSGSPTKDKEDPSSSSPSTVDADVDVLDKLRRVLRGSNEVGDSPSSSDDDPSKTCSYYQADSSPESASILQGYSRKDEKYRLDPYLRALLRIIVDGDLNLLWRERLEEILREDEDLARKELKKGLRNKEDAKRLRSEGATEVEIDVAAGHTGFRDETIFEEQYDDEQCLNYILQQVEVLNIRDQHTLLQESVKKLNMLTTYINLVTKSSDSFEDVLDKVLENTAEANDHAVESKEALDMSETSIQVALSKVVLGLTSEKRRTSSTTSKIAENVNPSFLQLASFSHRNSFFTDAQMQNSQYDQGGSQYDGTRRKSLGNLYGSFHGSFHGSMRGSRHFARAQSGQFDSVAGGSLGPHSFNFLRGSSYYGQLPNQQDEEEKAAELGWKLLENGLRLYKFRRRRPRRKPKARIFTLVDDQQLTWSGTKQPPVSVFAADQELPSWMSEEKAETQPWIQKHFHGLSHFLENSVRLKVHNKQEDTWEVLLVARSQEIALSILAVFKEEADRKSMIESVYDGGRRSSLMEMDGKMERVHRRNSIDRLQTAERSKRSRNKVLIHQQGHSVLKKANMSAITESGKTKNPQFRTKERQIQKRAKEEEEFLLPLLQKNPIFSNLERKDLQNVCGMMRKITITDGMELVHQGSFATNFYIVENGMLACISVEKENKLKKKSILNSGDHFGETSLILKSPLPFSVVSVKESTLWALDQETFARIFSKNKDLQKAIETLVEVTIFNSLDDAWFSDMILKCKLVKFAPGEAIANEDDYPGFFYVLQDGQVLVSNNWYSSDKDKDGEVKFNKKLAIPGDFFGDFEICYSQAFTSTYVAADEGASMLLINASFFQKMRKNIEKAVVDNLKIQVLHSLPTFASLDEREVIDVLAAFEFHKYKKGNTIIKKGAIEDQFYFLKKGQCIVLDDIKKPSQVMTRVKGHGSFGELALLSDEPRSAWVIAESDVEVYSLRALQFNRLVKLVKEQSTKDHMVHVLQLIDLLSVLSSNDYKLLSEAFVQEPFQGGDKLIQEGDTNDKLYIVSRGEFLLTRVIADGSSTERVRLLPGNYFGERALLGPEKCNYSVTASRLSGICTISRHVFEQYCGNLSNLLQDALKKTEEETKLLSLERQDFFEKGIIGRGSFGSVRLVQEKVSKKWYAMKCLIKKDIVNKSHQKNLKQEIQIMNLLDHEMIIRLKKKWQDDRFIYLLTDVCSGGELYDEMRKHGKFDESRSKFYAACIVSVLSHMRERKIVYRDLKPENVLITTDGYLKLIDFGFAKKLEIGEKANSFCGTPDYIAPEVLLNEGYNYAVDIWGLGVLVYEMIAGRTPFRMIPNSSNKVVMKNIVNKKVSYTGEAFGKVTKECIDFIKNCLKKEQLFRLGSKDVNEMKEHPWFADFGQHGWNALERKLIKPPFIPQDTDPDKIKVKSAKAKELTIPPVVQDYELDTIFADDELFKQGVFGDFGPQPPAAAMLNQRRQSLAGGNLAHEIPQGVNLDRRRSSVHSIGSVGSQIGDRLAVRRSSIGSVGSVGSIG
ncbi:cGMP-dependent protein kinase [Chloropicon primus]|uniref:cGMP-dependent protein kinase n=1 Tax=Chloropicon primus TaxID=1764295 RepID=A0A5B8MVR3_9CHLO|nr:cGMP-dependent protein kinase [Chloropicon primus]|eukprot:QDZ24888.1 cGMP-dependent protein kinase [Chloropicon primus]